MATIQVYKHGTDTLLGSGDGTVDTKNQTAIINTWTSKAGLGTGTQYKLKASSKTYADANCTGVSATAPVASFGNVS
jgi:hypothetical protein